MQAVPCALEGTLCNRRQVGMDVQAVLAWNWQSGNQTRCTGRASRVCTSVLMCASMDALA